MSLFDSAMRAINTAGMTELETTAFKATYPDDNRVKEKHVETLLRMADHYRPDVIVRLLGSRAREREWFVVLKALGVAHRLMREGNVRFFQACTTMPVFAGLNQFLDESSTNAWGQTRFIREYGGYLEEKCDVMKTLGKSVELLPAKDGGEWIRKLAFLKLREVLPRLQSQFDRLLKCSPYTDEGGLHEVAILPMLQLIKDGFRLYSVLTISVFQQLNRWQQMQKREGLFFLDCYEKFAKQTSLFKQWAIKMVKLNLVDKEVLPEFDNLPANLIPTLDAYFRKNFKGPADAETPDDADAGADEEEEAGAAAAAAGDDEEEEVVEEEEEEIEQAPPPRRAAAAASTVSRQSSQPGARPASAAAVAQTRRSPTAASASVAAVAQAGAAGVAPRSQKPAAAAKAVPASQAGVAKPAAKKVAAVPTAAFDLLDLNDAPAPARKPAAAASAAAKSKPAARPQSAAAARRPAPQPVVQPDEEEEEEVVVEEEEEVEFIEVEEEVEVEEEEEVVEEEEVPAPPPRKPVRAAAAAAPVARRPAAAAAAASIAGLDDLFVAPQPQAQPRRVAAAGAAAKPAAGAGAKAKPVAAKKVDPFADLHFDDGAASPPSMQPAAAAPAAARKPKVAGKPVVDPFDFR